jgi:hypothetical protein
MEEDRRAIESAKQTLRRIDQVLEKSDRVSREELPKLRRAGLLR